MDRCVGYEKKASSHDTEATDTAAASKWPRHHPPTLVPVAPSALAIVVEISARLRVGQPAPGHGDVAATVGVRGTTVGVAYTIIVEPWIAVPVLRDPAGIVAGERGPSPISLVHGTMHRSTPARTTAKI
jgi:hypothetical protein